MTANAPAPAESPTPDQQGGMLTRLSNLVTKAPVRWGLLIFWIAVVVIAAPIAGRIGEVEDNGSKGFLPASSESLEVLELQDQFPAGDTTAAAIIYQREDGLTDDDRVFVEANQAEIAESHPDFQVTDPVPSEDGKAILITAILPTADDEELATGVGDVRDIIQTDAPDGLNAKVTGPAGIGVDLGEVFAGINGRLLVSAAIVVAILLLITYRSPFLWAIPLLVVGFADRLATAFVFGLAKAFDFPTSGQSVGIMAILVFGAGTDYALLLIARYREELRRHEKPATAMAVALRQAVPAILASGGTVILALACLLVADLNSNRLLGPTGISGILCALLLTLSLLPVILVLVGRKVFWPFVPQYGSDAKETSGVWARVGTWVSHNPRRIWITTVILLLIASAGVLGYNTSFTQSDQFTDKPEAIQGAELIAESFPAGSGSPTIVIANKAQTDQVMGIIQGVDGVASANPAGETDDFVQFMVTLSAEPGSTEAFNTVRDLRTSLDDAPDVNALVGGSDAESLDTSVANSRDQELVIPLVFLVIFIVLAVLLKSLLAPVVLIFASIISTLTALGVTVLVFENLLGYEGMQAGVVLLGFVFLSALGVDYSIFLMSRVHEESPHIGTRSGMLRALSVTGGVITSAGIVLAATFAVLGILPLVALAQVGFLVSFGVLLDTLIVRSILVPAITFDLDKRIWWPSALSKKDGAPEEDVSVSSQDEPSTVKA